MKTLTVFKKDPRVLEKRRLRAISLLKRHVSPADIARKFDVSRQAVHLWQKTYDQRGVTALHSTKSDGRPSKYPIDQIRSQLPRILKAGALAYGFPTDIWTTATIGALIQKEMGVQYHRDHVRKILHRIKFSWQKPKKRAVERNERRIRYWTNHTWPDIKKKP